MTKGGDEWGKMKATHKAKRNAKRSPIARDGRNREGVDQVACCVRGCTLFRRNFLVKSLALETQLLLETQLPLETLLRLDLEGLEVSEGPSVPAVTVAMGSCDSAADDSSTVVAVAACTDTPITKDPSRSSITGRERARDRRRGRREPTVRVRVWRGAILCTWVT